MNIDSWKLPGFESEDLLGVGQVLPKISLRGESPREIEGTIWHKSSDGKIRQNYWRIGVGEAYQWKEGGTYSYKLEGAEPGYYYYNKRLYAFEPIGLTWNDAVTVLIAKGKAVKALNKEVVDSLVKDEFERRVPRPKPNRNSSVQLGVNTAILQDWKDNARF